MPDLGITRSSLLAASLDWILEATILARLTQSEQDKILAVMSWRQYPANHVIVPEGVASRGVDLIVEGRVALERGSAATALRVLGPGQIVGERALLRGEPTSATVRALGPTRALHLEPGDFRVLLVHVPGLRPALEVLVELRERSRELTELLLRNPILRLLGRDGLERLIDAATLKRVPKGQRLVTAGDRGRDVFLLVEGRLAVYAPSIAGAPRELLATERPGAMIGHAAALLESPRTADVEPLEPSEILEVPARAFMDLVSQNPSLLRRLYQQLAAMDVRADDARSSRGAGMLVSVFGTRSSSGATTVGYGLAASLAESSPVVLVDLGGPSSASRLGLATRPSDVGPVAVTELVTPASWPFHVLWPHDRQRTRDLLGALRDARPDAHIVVVASSRDAEDVTAMEACEAVVFVRLADDLDDRFARRAQFRVEALRVHAGLASLPYGGPSSVRVPDDPATVAAFWRDGDPHVLRDEQYALGRACRRLSRVLLGRSVGLALGGGGALGFAHVGLLRAFHGAGIPVDYVAGSSFGALVAGIFAAGGLDALERLIEQRRSLQAHVWASMFTSSAIGHFVDRLVGVKQMTEIEVPFLPVAMDLLTGRQIVLQRGTIGEGVRSSACLPGPFAAWRRGSWRLVDGGIINNVPASVVWEAGAHFIVASNTIPRSTAPVNRLPPALGGLESQLMRFDDMLRSMYFLMSQTGRDRATLADYVFDLDLPMYSIQDVTRGEVIADAGQRQAEGEIASILEAYRTDGSARTIPP